MTEEEAKKTVSEISIALAHTDQLTEELHKHLDFITTKLMNLVDAFNG